MEQSQVKIITIRILKVVVNSYSPGDQRIVLSAYFDDGCQRKIRRSAHIGDPYVLVAKLLDEILLKARDENCEFDGEQMSDADIRLDKEMLTVRQLADFFRTIYSKSQQIRNATSGVGYLDMIRQMQRFQVTLYGE